MGSKRLSQMVLRNVEREKEVAGKYKPTNNPYSLYWKKHHAFPRKIHLTEVRMNL